MKNLLNIINVPRNISRYRKKRTIETVTGEKMKKEELVYILYSFTGLLLAIITFSLKSYNVLYVSLGIILLFTFIVILISRGSLSKINTSTSTISKIILKNEDNKVVKLWEIKNQKSLLIGKKTTNNEVDIDLSSAIYASLISREHAIMNFSGEKWYFEDIGSSNGSGIKRKKEEKKIKVEEGKSYRIYPGDLIYIANTVLTLK